MSDDKIASRSASPENIVERALAATPARLLVGRAGPSYSTATWLKLRADHAAARDAVYADLDLPRDFGEDLVREYQLFLAQTRARTRSEYLMRPDLGRTLADESRQRVSASCPAGADLQVVIGDGLSSAAVAAQAPRLLELLERSARQRGWRFGRGFAVRYCRVGVLNEIGELLQPAVVALLIGERPGLAAADSLSAYLAFRPRTGHTDANRNLISNIHSRGIDVEEAARRIVALAETMRRLGKSGFDVKEELPPPGTGVSHALRL
jgi:ethanolamine ammonia-lyase small subunit